MKKCTKCKEIKELSKFSKHLCHKDGLCSQCKDCDKIYVALHREQRIAYGNIYRESKQEQRKIYREDHKAEKKAYDYQYVKDNPGKIIAKRARRRASELQAIPPWLSSGQHAEIEWYYTTAKELQWLSDEPLEVDHIEPLQGEDSCGLHVPWNLQILPRSLNRSKQNKGNKSK
jgi:hypothetical protein